MLTKNELSKKLSSIKIREKYVIIHSDISGLVFRNFSLKDLWSLIFNSLGKEKTYILPTFTFDFYKKKIWDYNYSKSETGLLSEFFRLKIAKKRTIHPLHSVAIYSKNPIKFLNHNSKTSFGKGSIWEWVSNSKNVCNLAFGIGLDGGASFCHYAEEYSKVNYRSIIDLQGKVYDKDKKLVKKKFQYFSRKKKLNIFNDWSRCERELKKSNLIKTYSISKIKYQILKMNTYKVTRFITKKLRSNPKYLTK